MARSCFSRPMQARTLLDRRCLWMEVSPRVPPRRRLRSDVSTQAVNPHGSPRSGNLRLSVFGVDDAADEATVLREKLPLVVDGEDALDIELDAALVVGLVEIKQDLGVEPEGWILPVVRDGLLELLVDDQL